MKSLKRPLSLALALAMALSLTACGSKDKPDAASNGGSSSSAGDLSANGSASIPNGSGDASQPDKSAEPDKSVQPDKSQPAASEPQQPEKPAVPAEMTYTFDAATGTLTCSGGGEITQAGWIKAVKNAIFETNEAKCKEEIKKVVIEDGVTAIGREAFRDTPVTEVIMPDSVTRIGSIAFGWTQITSIKISENATEIAEAIFRQCKNLSSVILPKSLTSIPIEIFEGCSSLTSIQIPDGVTTIGYTAFMGCPITQITIPASVTHLENNLLSYCESLTDVTFLGDTDMDHVGEWLVSLLSKPITIHAPAGSVIEGYVNRQISQGEAKCTFVPLG